MKNIPKNHDYLNSSVTIVFLFYNIFLIKINVYKLSNICDILYRASFEIFGKNIQDCDAFQQTLRTD